VPVHDQDGRATGTLALRPALNLLPYQRRWVEDNSPLKIVVKARQIGYSFAATLRAVLQCLEKKSTWIFLSKGERQSRLLMEKVQEHIQSCGIVAQACESTFFEGTLIKQLEVRFANGSVIYGLPANPDTARGYTGHVTLDEFAFHTDADKIYTALYPTITRGYGLEVISTPNGHQGKFYELARAAGLLDGPTPSPPAPLPRGEGGPQGRVRGWSAHSCDIYEALRQGLKINLELLRAGCEDEATWQQEFGCQFVSTAENFFPPELLAACLSAEASTDFPPHLLASASSVSSRQSAEGSRQQEGIETTSPRLPRPGSANSEFTIQNSEFFLGIDIGRQHDRTVFWLDEVLECGSLLPPSSRQLAAAGAAPPFGIAQEQAPERHSGGKPPHSTESARLSITRLVRVLDRVPFAEQLEVARELLSLRVAPGLSRSTGVPPVSGHGQDGRATSAGALLIRRACIDATGIGAPLAEALEHEFGPRVEPIVFTAAVKEDLAYRTKRRLENRLSLLPDTREIRRAFSVVKRFVTPSGNLRFDAVRTEAGHADEFWAKALADLAADSQPVARATDGFLASGAPLIRPSAFEVTDTAWAEWETL
jgi:phage FluMu gp28-like protein